MGNHAVASASSLKRLAQCPGSMQLCKGVPSADSSYSAEGTVAHAVLAAALRAGFPRAISSYLESIVDEGGFKIEVTIEMLGAIAMAYEHISRYRATFPHGLERVEFDVTNELKRIHPLAGGTADHFLYDPVSKTLIVTDYKHGAGVFVDVNDNLQGITYAIGAAMYLASLGKEIETVAIVIVQPRHFEEPKIRSRGYSVASLREFVPRIQSIIAAADAPGAPLNTGQECQFCPARRECPKLREMREGIVAREFAPVGSEALAADLETIPLLRAWMKSVQEFAEIEARAGRIPPRHKWVNGRGSKSFAGKTELLTWIGENRAPSPLEIMSPAAYCEMLNKEQVADLHKRGIITSAKGLPQLAHMSDRRKEVPTATFTPLPGATT